ncbi:MAG: diol dehydratase small subunit [Aggregatilineales bacterium]
MTSRKYPLAENEVEQLRAASGKRFDDLTLDVAISGELTPDDLRIHAETLRAQAEIARQAGHPQFADNLLRAAELTAVPNDKVLQIYDLLRPGRASFQQLTGLADMLEKTYHALATAGFLREAAEVYRARGLLRRDS